jgi:DNA-binding transcriptional regulator YiaG
MRPMANLVSLLKNEIARVARKELRGETRGLKQSAASHRAEMAALKRRLLALERQVRGLSRASAKAAPAMVEERSPPKIRFSAKGLASQRQRLALSAQECGQLVGASGQSVYNWEQGKARPQARHLPAIAALRTLGKREATARLEALRQGPAGSL